MNLVTIIDENGELAQAMLKGYSFGEVAIVDGRYLLPEAFYVVTEAQAEDIRRAELRARGLAFI